MPGRRKPVIRHRVLVWTDEAGDPAQVAIARYVDDEKQWERTWAAEPFGTAGEHVDDALRSLDVQLKLWQDAE